MKLRQKGEAKRAALHEPKTRAPAPLGPEKQVDRRSTPSRHSTLGVPTKHGTLGVGHGSMLCVGGERPGCVVALWVVS